jgi:HEAT repeat protein
MPTETESRVMSVLTSIEVPSNAAQTIGSWGNDAVTVVCEAALGTYPGFRPKVRYNAVALLGQMSHPQATETIPLLINEPDPDVSIRAMRAAGRQKNERVVDALEQLLKKGESPPLLAAEAVSTLSAIRSPKAQAILDAYTAAGPDAYPHRGSAVVADVLEARRER